MLIENAAHGKLGRFPGLSMDNGPIMRDVHCTTPPTAPLHHIRSFQKALFFKHIFFILIFINIFIYIYFLHLYFFFSLSNEKLFKATLGA